MILFADCQLPVYSPIGVRALAMGAIAAAGRGTAERFRDEVVAMLRREDSCEAVCLTASGTDALTLAVQWSSARLGGGPVALPAYGCYDLATAAIGAGVQVVLYDVGVADLSPDLDSLEAAMKRGVRTVVVAHLFGHPVDVVSIQQLVRAYDGILVNDAAQAAGGQVGGEPAAVFGDVSVLSFGRGKGTTAGAGGALLGRGAAAAAVAAMNRGLRVGAGIGTLATASALWLLGRPALYGFPASVPFLRLGETVFHPPTPARGMTRAARGILRWTLRAAHGELLARRRHAERLLRRVAAAEGVTSVKPTANAAPGYLRLPVLLEKEAAASRDETRRRKRLGIQKGYPRSLVDLGGFADRVQNRQMAFAGARALARGLVTLPTHSRMTDRDLEEIERWIARPS